MISFVLVHLGPSEPPYLEDCLRQIRRYNANNPIYLVISDRTPLVERLAGEGLCTPWSVDQVQGSPAVQRFDRKAKVDRQWRGGFNYFANKRFLYIAALLEQQKLERVVHLEYDNLLYFSADELEPLFVQSFPSLGLVLDNDDRCIPGVLYVPEPRAISRFVRWYLAHCLGKKENDMESLATYRWKKLPSGQLPLAPPGYFGDQRSASTLDGHQARRVAPYGALFERFGGIFDAACLGQFLGGVDPRNAEGDTRGFVNEASILDPSKLSFEWRTDAMGRRAPWARLGAGAPFPILNLHVHSKNLKPFLS